MDCPYPDRTRSQIGNDSSRTFYPTLGCFSVPIRVFTANFLFARHPGVAVIAFVGFRRVDCQMPCLWSARRELHSYDTPECMSLITDDGSEAYLKWPAESVE
jgi:hypothetical protein